MERRDTSRPLGLGGGFADAGEGARGPFLRTKVVAMWRANPPPSMGATWLVVAATTAALLITGAVVVLGGKQGPQPPFLEAEADADAPAPRRRAPGEGLVIAGSGSNLPITRVLVSGFRGHGPTPVVQPSIGSGGGIRALLDGVIDIALVSRSLKEGERALGLVSTPYARVPVIVAVHSDVPDTEITTPELVAVYAGHRHTWSDGSRISVLQRERGDSSHRAVGSVVPGFDETNQEAYREARWRVLYHDDAMTDALDSTPGAVGLFGQGGVPRTRSIRALRVDGIAPTVDAVASQRYPFTKDLAFVTLGEPRERVGAFIEFARSPEGQVIIREAGGMPLADNIEDGGRQRQADP